MKLSVVLLAYLVGAVYADCEYKIADFKEGLPLFIKNNAIVYPNNQRVKFSENEVVGFVCAGKKNEFSLRSLGQHVSVTCQDGQLDINGQHYSLQQLRCAQPEAEATVKSTSETCANQLGQIKEVGFQYGNNFFTLYKSCYNTKNLQSLYSVNTLGGTYWQECKRPQFSEEQSGASESDPIKRLYTRRIQKETLTKLSPSFSKYLQKDFLARGHFAPNGDFNYCSTQAASFFYINVAPQWQRFNGGNWVSVEKQVRKLIKKVQQPFVVFTGTHGVLEFNDENQNSIPIYLAENEKLPVPQFYWKVVINPQTGESIAFIGLNNVYAHDGNALTELCTNVCQQQRVSAKGFNETKNGVVTCCRLEEVRKHIPNMADIPTSRKLMQF